MKAKGTQRAYYDSMPHILEHDIVLTNYDLEDIDYLLLQGTYRHSSGSSTAILPPTFELFYSFFFQKVSVVCTMSLSVCLYISALISFFAEQFSI